MNWDDLTTLEPRLLELERYARTLPRHWGRPGYRTWQQDLTKLVGWHADHPALRSSACYDVAHRRILDAWEVR